jgi:uncharacterized protein (DUF1778 family)
MATVHQVTQSFKQERIVLRTTPKVKSALAYAAELTGAASMSAFMIEAAYEKAKSIIKENEVITLNDHERDRFLSLLEKPAKPNARLKQAMKKYLARNE